MRHIPDGYTAVTPYLIAREAERLLEFAKNGLGAEVKDVHRDQTGRIMHAEFTIDGAPVMMGQANEQWPEKLGSIHLYVRDADALYRSALAAGATSIYEPTNHFYGDRSCGVVDPAGMTWWISTHVEDVSPEEMERRMKAGAKG